MAKLIFEERVMTFRISEVWYLDRLLPRVIGRVYLPDQSYGQFLFYNGNEPKFYFNIFESEALLAIVDRLVKEQGTDAQQVLLFLLRSVGYANANTGIRKGAKLFTSNSIPKSIPVLYAVDHLE